MVNGFGQDCRCCVSRSAKNILEECNLGLRVSGRDVGIARGISALCDPPSCRAGRAREQCLRGDRVGGDQSRGWDLWRVSSLRFFCFLDRMIAMLTDIIEVDGLAINSNGQLGSLPLLGPLLLAPDIADCVSATVSFAVQRSW